ncbi:MAG: hypothetical protein ACTSSP_01835 [Candidatus Asgardarchaeia archaeon]
MLKENNDRISLLASLFLSYRDPDEAYHKILGEIRRLYNDNIHVDINRVQDVAYNGGCNRDDE